jgi:hypothetical protein
MNFTFQSDGLAEISRMLNELGDKAAFVGSHALYEGAGRMADAIFAEINNIQTAPFKYAGPGETRLPSPEEKAVLQQGEAFGITKFEKDGNEINTSVGLNGSGYANVNWNHMNSSARTNYKDVAFKGKENAASSTLKTIRYSGKAEQYGLSSTIGRGAQNQKPISVIANAINSGTSFMQKQPFVRKGVSKGKKTAVAAMVAEAEKLFNAIISQNEAGGKSA